MRHRFEKTSQRIIWTRLFAFATALISLLGVSQVTLGEVSATREDEITILTFGDSLTAGYQIPPETSFPAQLQKALREKGYNVRVINSGVSGDTAAEGLARLDWSLDGKIDGAIVEFGANDALRGLDLKVTEKAIDDILKALRERKIELLLAGMEAPRNWGPEYDASFREIYPRLAAKYGTLFYPFFLKDVATVRNLNLADGLHPTPEGVAVIVRNILPNAEKLIARIRSARASNHS
jgi:acyl-CoA thioesterase-1